MNAVDGNVASDVPAVGRVGMLTTPPQALLDMADAYSARGWNASHRPAPRDVEVGEGGGRRPFSSSLLGDSPPPPPASTSSLPPPPLSTPDPKADEDPMDVATPPGAHDGLFPRPSAPPLEMLIEDGYYDETSTPSSITAQRSIRPTPTDASPPGDAMGGRLQAGMSKNAMSRPPPPPAADPLSIPPHPSVADARGPASWMSLPLAEATAVMSLDEALPMAGPAAPDRDGGNVRRGGTIGALAGLWLRQGKYVKIGLVSLGLMTLGAIISVMIMKLGIDRDDDNITISTTTPSASPTISIWKQQGVAIVGDAADDLLGNSVAVSADASTIVVGARGNHENDSKTGYVKVYRTIDDSGNMVQLGQTIYGDVTGDQFGWSVDIAANENTIVIGSPGYWDVDDRPGYMRVFSLDNDDDIGTNTWKQIGQDIIGEEDGDDFGWSVSISGDSKTIAVGADEYDGENGIDSGLVRVYRMDDSQSDWIQIGNDIEGEAAGDWLGSSVSLPADGNKVAIGSAGSDDNGDFSGHVIVYQMNSARSSWEQLGQTLYGDNADDFSGWSVDLSPDGKTLAIGSPGSSDGGDRPGYVRVFSLKVSGNNSGTSSWEQIGLDIFGEAKGDLFGMTVSLSNDGRTIAIGATNNDGEDGVDSGHVRVYRMDDSKSDWVQIGDDIDGDAPYDTSGTSVSLSADGDTVAIGSDWNDENGAEAGHVQVYILE